MAKLSKTKGKTTQPPKKKKRRLDFWNKLAIAVLTFFLIGCISVFFILVNVINDPEGMRFSQDGLAAMSNSRIYDANGQMVYEFGEEIRDDITYDALPQSVIDAFLSIEDSRFFDHNGFDLPRFIAAGIADLRSGGFAQGGSTLTMQMIDNAFTKNQEEKLLNEKGSISKIDQLKLKIQEVYLSLIAEQNLSKEEIFTYYVNRIWFGSGNSTRGIQKASQYYFDKNVQDVTLEEAAFLAGSVNAPGRYNPLANLTDPEVDHLDAAVQRRNLTLRLMLQHGYITEDEYNLAVGSRLSYRLVHNEDAIVTDDPNQAYIDEVIEETQQLTGQDPGVVPMDIYTAMNPDVQKEADLVCAGEIINYPNQAFDIGFGIVDNTNGEVIAVGPGRTYHTDSVKHNNATDSRQPGSSMKPLLAYCSTFDILGWST
ncbi:MAG: transglycosylase domain-containing protein, partial [Erysipelotrichaceae bacterium]|nr:transglycosylase domain-containing protein [Erysipelotrichaceae bacterium]